MKQSKKSSNILITLAVLLVGSVAVYMIFRFLKKRKAEQVEEQQLNEAVAEEQPDERDRIRSAYQEIKEGLAEEGITDENFVRLNVAQASFESDRFDSSVYRGNNNPYGMRHPKIRPTTSLGDTNNDGYANYESMKSAARDYALWTKYNHLPEAYDAHDYATIQKFAGLLKSKGYFEDTVVHYINGMKTCMSELLNILNQG